ncbi:MAG: radical SAM protein, partial [Bacilli bacterium]|nr:radical SAM protein [Bacilli bacterium]
MRTILAKHIIQPNNNFNLYHGCTHGCIYCDSRSLCYNLGEFEDIGVKANALKLMDQELSHKR